MATRVIMPKQGLQMAEGTILKWLSKEGEKVQQGKPLFEMETDKLTITMDSPDSGTLLKIVRKEGEVVPITELIAVIGKSGEDISELLGGAVEEKKSEKAVEDKQVSKLIAMEEGVPFEEEKCEGARVFVTPRAKMRAEEAEMDYKAMKGSGPEGLVIEKDVLKYISEKKDVKATPLARKSAEVNNIDIAKAKGTGVRGKVTKEDIEKLIGKPVEEKIVAGRAGKLIPFTGMRKVIAKRMVESLHIAAQANHRMSVDMTESLRLKNKLKENGVKVSITDILIKMVCLALRKHPLVNSMFTEEGVLLLDDVSIGVAVALEDGLIVPVVKNADMLTLEGINKATGELVEKAKTGKLTPDEMTGGTFTISNLGMYDIDSFTAIVNQPESAILAVGKTTKMYVVEDDKPVIRPIMTLSLSYDHRVIDGAPAAMFLKTLKGIIENPYLLV